MKYTRPMVALLCATMPFAVQAQTELVYRMTLDGKSDGKVLVSVDTSKYATISVHPARADEYVSQPMLTCISPKGDVLSLNYGESKPCKQVDWELNLAQLEVVGMDISNQRDTYSKVQGWYYVSEFNSLPRFSASPEKPTLMGRVCMPTEVCSSLPSENQPPLFLIWEQKNSVRRVQDADPNFG